MEALASPIRPMVKGILFVMLILTVLNIETARKAFSAVRASPVKPNTANVQRRINLEAVKKKLKLKAR